MKILLLTFLFSIKAFSATCTSPSYSNYTFGQVLSSSSLNTNFNNLFNFASAIDGGCVSDGTLEFSAVNTTDWAVALNAPQLGCSVSYTSANTATISKCIAAVNGAFVKTTVTTAATFGCSNCSADSASTTYYVYIANGSSGTTLTPLILTTAPNADGYDSSGNKVLARFYNNASSAIDQYSIDQWHVNSFIPSNTDAIAYTPTGTWVSNSTYTGFFKRIGKQMEIQMKVATSGAPTSATLSIDIPSGYLIDSAKIIDTNAYTVGHGQAADNGGAVHDVDLIYLDTNTVQCYAKGAGSTYLTLNALTQAVPFTWGASDVFTARVLVPIVGWLD